MINDLDKQMCCGCSSCVQRCPMHCIKMTEDNEGFLYPQIEKEVCINCGLCEKVCPFITPYSSEMPKKVLGVINKKEDIRLKSSSGGVFTLIAEPIIKAEGIVFGARFDEEWQVVMDYTETMEGLSAFRGSKYVQARINNSYQQCKKFLKQGRKVLYTGSPCQVAGLNHYLGKKYENLITCDFICHGVPSPKVWKLYLHTIVSSGVKAIHDIQFRNKRNGWKQFNFQLKYDNNKKYINMYSCHKKNHFMRAFLSNMILRPSCYTCKAKQGSSKSDITIGDFWGINTLVPEMDDDKGTSLVMINTEKGEMALELGSTAFVESIYNLVCHYNEGLNPTAKPHPKRRDFFQELESTENIIKTIDKYTKPSLKNKILQMVKQVIQILIRHGGGKNESTKIVCNQIEGTIKNITFREKKGGWKKYGLSIEIS